MLLWRRVFIGLLTLFSFAFAAEESEAKARQFPWRGVFEPRAEAVIPAEMAGTVIAMPKRPGDRCTVGDVLVEFDASLPEAAVEAIQAKLDAEEQNHKGMVNLYERNQVTSMELARAESEYIRARVELAVAYKEVAACRVLAPFSGKMVEEKVRAHEWADKGAPLLLLVDDTLLKVRFFLPEDNFSKISLGDPVLIWASAVSREVKGTVSRLGVVFDPVSRTFDAWADVDNSNDLLRAGMTAEVAWPIVGESE